MVSPATAPNSTYTERGHSRLGGVQCVKAWLTVVASVGATDSGRVDTSLTGSLEAVCADSNAGSDCVYFEAIEGLEVKPDGND